LIKTAGPITSRILRLTGFAGMVAPNGVAYLLAEHIDNAALRAHEQCHLDQMQRDGWTFWPRVVWYVIVCCALIAAGSISTTVGMLIYWSLQL
jgi:uncharacterized protein YjeT (DUF2065 family)